MTEEKVYNQEINEEKDLAADQTCTSEEQAASDNMAETEGEEQVATDTVADKEDADEWREKFLRLQAEFDNYRKRTLREKMDLVQSGGSDTLKAFLPVVDDIDRAQDAMGKSDDIEALRQGVDLIAAKFNEILKQRGVVEIEALGMDLDTDHHEAIARFAAGEEQKGKIIDVIQKGYMMGDKVLRFAKVVVGE